VHDPSIHAGAYTVSNKSLLELHTDRTVAATKQVDASIQRQTGAVQRQTAAIRAQTAAINEQTDTMNEGFAATVDSLHQQTDVLRSIDLSMSSVARDMRGLRDDIYAAAQNREALEAKSKLDRAEQLMSSNLPADALRLIREAEVLNPADFAVWSMKVMFCARALESGPEWMNAEEAKTEGSAALERAVKLFPAGTLGSARSLGVLRWMVGTAILLESAYCFQLAVGLYRRSVDEGGSDASLSPPATGMTRFLGDVQQSAAAFSIAEANGRLLTRIAERGDPVAIRAMLPAWADLVQVCPEAVGPEVAVAIAASLRQSVTQFVQAIAAAKGRPPGANPNRERLKSWLTQLNKESATQFDGLKAWRQALRETPVDVAEMDGDQRKLEAVCREWELDAWLSGLPKVNEPPPPRADVLLVIGLVTAVIAVGALWGGKSFLVAVINGVIAVVNIGLWVRGLQASLRPPASPNTAELLERVKGLIDTWSAAS
jgi:hypothetical protein